MIYKGKNIGTVSELKISKNRNIDVYVELPVDFKIPVDSDFIIFASDVLGKRAINIEFSDAGIYYLSSDKIKGKNQLKWSEKTNLVLNQ